MSIKRGDTEFTIMELEMTEPTRQAVRGLKSMYRGKTRGPKKLTCNAAIQLYSYINGCHSGTYNLAEEVATMYTFYSLGGETYSDDDFINSRWFDHMVHNITDDVRQWLSDYINHHPEYSNEVQRGVYHELKRDIALDLFKGQEFEEYSRNVTQDVKALLFEPTTMSI